MRESNLIEIASLLGCVALRCPCFTVSLCKPVTGNLSPGRQYYRLYAINCIPSLTSLDYIRIKPAERDRARRLASSAAGAALESDVQASLATTEAAKSFEPGEANKNGGRSFVTVHFSEEQKDMIRDLLSKASSAQEIEEIESSVRKGVLPSALQAQAAE